MLSCPCYRGPLSRERAARLLDRSNYRAHEGRDSSRNRCYRSSSGNPQRTLAHDTFSHAELCVHLCHAEASHSQPQTRPGCSRSCQVAGVPNRLLLEAGESLGFAGFKQKSVRDSGDLTGSAAPRPRLRLGAPRFCVVRCATQNRSALSPGRGLKQSEMRFPGEPVHVVDNS